MTHWPPTASKEVRNEPRYIRPRYICRNRSSVRSRDRGSSRLILDFLQMNTHDIELPPLPEWMCNFQIPADDQDDSNFNWLDWRMKEYARAAIEADRKRRGEPAAQALFAENGVEADDYKTWYEEAIVRSNEAGFAGMSAAQVIDYQDGEIMQLRKSNSKLVEVLETALFGTPLDDVPNRDNDDIWRICYPHLPEHAANALRDHLDRIETALADFHKGDEL